MEYLLIVNSEFGMVLKNTHKNSRPISNILHKHQKKKEPTVINGNLFAKIIKKIIQIKSETLLLR